MGFAWNNFGILDASKEDDGYLYIYNQNGDWRKISKSKYSSSMADLKRKIKTLTGKPILFRTSQNTAAWSTSEWFSDIDIDTKTFLTEEASTPFTQSIFSAESEPTPESDDSLRSKLKKAEAEKEALRKKHSDEKEDWKTEANDLKGRNSSLEIENASMRMTIKEDKEAQSNAEKAKEEADAKKLSEMNLLGNEYHVLVRGHPARQLALRVGKILPVDQKNIKIQFVQDENRNNYRVKMPQFDNVEAIASIGLNNNSRMYVASFRNINSDYYFRRFEEVMGEPEKNFKDREMTDEERVEIFRKVMGE